MNRSIALLIACSLGAACATTRTRPVDGWGAPGPTASASECGALSVARAPSPDAEAPLVSQVMQLACADSIARDAEPGHRNYVALHARFDMRRFDQLAAAIMVVTCAADGACRAEEEPESLGQLAFYARGLDVRTLPPLVAKLGVSGKVGDAFVARAEASRALVLAEVERLDPIRTRLYVELPDEVREQERRDWRTFAKYYTRFDELVPRVDRALANELATAKELQPLVTQTTKLRDEFLSRCAARSVRSAQECLSGPLARPLTERLVRLAVRLEDGILAQAEHSLLELGPDRSTTARRIAAVQAAALEEDEPLAEISTEVAAANPDEASPEEVLPIAWQLPRDSIGLRGQIRRLQQKVDLVRGTVRFVRTKGDRAEIYFFDEHVAGVECMDLRAEAMPEDLQDCSPDTSKAVQISRVFLALADAKQLLIGNRLEAVIDRETRRGLAVQVRASKQAEQVVQVRSVRWTP